MTRRILFLLFLLLPGTALAEAPAMERPHWSLEVKGGLFIPALQDWSYYYGKRDMPEFGVALAYQITRMVEVGAGSAWSWAEGQALRHGSLSGNVTYDRYPVDLFVMLRGILNEEQLLVPYVGGGWTRMYYRQEVANQGTSKGSVDGYHLRAGVQISLDNLDQNASYRMYNDYGVYHTYFFVETEYTRAEENSTSTDLGGTSYRAGLRFEF